MMENKCKYCGKITRRKNYCCVRCRVYAHKEKRLKEKYENKT